LRVLAFARCPIAVGRIRENGSAAIGHHLAGQEVYPRRTEAVVSYICRGYAVAVALQHGGDGAGTAAWFPYSPPKLHMTKQRLGHPIWGGVEVMDFAIITGDMDWTAGSAPGRLAHSRFHLAHDKQVTNGLGSLHQLSTVLVVAEPLTPCANSASVMATS
jgi:hypothetical protein